MTYNTMSVTELNHYLKNKFEQDELLNNVLIEGEISNFKHHYTGHLYFTLKDENSLIKCIMFKTYTSHLEFKPEDGMKVMLLGTVSVFERDGTYQVYAKAIKQLGKVGDLHAAYEKLKAKLEEQGLFKQEHKKKIPVAPKCIGILTSNTGAVIKDIINVATRRNPKVYLKLLPVPVQGAGAAEKIAQGIELMNEQKVADVLIIARGGGSLEDLWPFNEEIVAKAIYASEIPIISAVGHETDFTIADFVADLRAPTPSAAAELAVPNVAELTKKIINYQNRYQLALRKKLEFMKLRYEKCMTRRAYTEPLQKIRNQKMMLQMQIEKNKNLIMKKLENSKHSASNAFSRLDTLSPLKTLSRGYGIVKLQGKVIKTVQQLNCNDEVVIQLSDGQKQAKIL